MTTTKPTKVHTCLTNASLHLSRTLHAAYCALLNLACDSYTLNCPPGVFHLNPPVYCVLSSSLYYCSVALLFICRLTQSCCMSKSRIHFILILLCITNQAPAHPTLAVHNNAGLSLTQSCGLWRPPSFGFLWSYHIITCNSPAYQSPAVHHILLLWCNAILLDSRQVGSSQPQSSCVL